MFPFQYFCFSSSEFGSWWLRGILRHDATVGLTVPCRGWRRIDATGMCVPLFGVHAVWLPGNLAQAAAVRVDAGQRNGQPQQAVCLHRPRWGHVLQRFVEIPLWTQHRRSVTQLTHISHIDHAVAYMICHCLRNVVCPSVTLCIINQWINLDFYRAMHNSAKRGIAIACRPSVRLWRW